MTDNGKPTASKPVGQLRQSLLSAVTHTKNVPVI